MAIAKTVENFLTQKSVNYDLVSHPHTGSSHETAEASHVNEEMVVVPASNWVEMKHLHKELDRDFKLVEEDELAKLFPDCEPGAIPPLGSAYQIETFLDEALTSLANVYFEAGDHENLVHTSGDNFKKLLSGVRHGNYSHDD
jgi:Ala-tRNA(Pro) deacylase